MCAVVGSYTADYTTGSDSDQHTKVRRADSSGGETVEEKQRARDRGAAGWGGWTEGVYGGIAWLVIRVAWDALVLLVGVALGVCATRAYGGYERRGEYQPIDRA